MRKDLQVFTIHRILWALVAGSVALAIVFWSANVATFQLIAGTIGGFDVSLGLRFDTLSILLLVMVALLGAIVGQYSLRYLDGEKKQRYFYRYLLFTIGAVCILVLSSNLLMFFAAWLATSYGLHQLLLYRDERPLARRAATKKFVVSRIGDVAILAAIALIYRVFGTFEFDLIFAEARELSSRPHAGLLPIAGFLLVVGAMTKSAQYPFHFWLPETMETPAPVSALMHAGIINAGGFLIIRLSPVLTTATAAHALLAVMGAFTAVFGVLVMITQSDIKKKLAYSTISQMGVMMFACGLGVYSIALFHMIAHSFYKAHAFLSTGMLVRESNKGGILLKPGGPIALFVSVLSGAAVVIAGFTLAGGAYSAYFTYAGVLLLGAFQSIGSLRLDGVGRARVYSQVALVFGVAATVFLAIEFFIHRELSKSLRAEAPATTFGASSAELQIHLFSFAIFVIGAWMSGLLMRPLSPRMRKLYVFFWNGGYFSVRTSKFLEN